VQILMVEFAGKGGMGAYGEALCQGLCQVGQDVTVLTSPAWPKRSSLLKVERGIIELTAGKHQRPQIYWAMNRFSIGVINSLRRNRFAFKHSPDVVHLQNGQPFIDQFCLKNLARRLPLVLTVHDVKPHNDSFIAKPSFLRRYFRIPHRLIVHHQDGKRQLIEDWGISGDKIDVIPHGIMPLYNPLSQLEARKKLDLPSGRRIILFFGVIRANKGLDVLLKAMQEISLSDPNMLLVIAGSQSKEIPLERYRDMIKNYGLEQNVRPFINFIEDEKVDAFFSASDIVVLPYLMFESQSGVLLRAYAHKKPVVASRVGAMSKLLENDKVGLLVESGQHEALAKAIMNVSDNFEQFRSRYTSEIEKMYSWERIAELTLESYRKAIAALRSKDYH
jgi:glycosyltransferase involved in cell wall biosynthesis